jgi:TolB-like protein
MMENAGSLVTREAILATVWPNVFVTDDSITQCVGDIRHAIGDEDQQMVRTAPRRGYVFTAEVRREAERMSGNRECAVVPRYRPSIAVLPFTNLSCDKDVEHAPAGVADRIATEISARRGLSVVPPAPSAGFGHGNDLSNARSVAAELAVNYVLEGSVRYDGGHVCLDVRLVGAGTGNLIWAERYHRKCPDIFSVENEIAAEVATSVQSAIMAAKRTGRFGGPGSWLDGRTAPVRNLMMAKVLTLGRDNGAGRRKPIDMSGVHVGRVTNE